MMSAKSTAASTPWRRTGWSVTSAQSSGCRQISKSAEPLADRPVLGQRPSGLAHEPHRRPLDRLAPGGPNQERGGHVPRLVPWPRPPRRTPSPRGRSPSAGSRTTCRRSAPAPRRSARLELENAGTAAWRSRPGRDIHLSYHWLDPLGNPIVWAGAFILLPGARRAGRADQRLRHRARADAARRLPARLRPRERGPLLVPRARQRAARARRRRAARHRAARARASRSRRATRELDGAARGPRSQQQEEPVVGEGEATAYLAGRVPAGARLVSARPRRARGGLRRRRRARSRSRAAGSSAAPPPRSSPCGEPASAARPAGRSRSCARRCLRRRQHAGARPGRPARGRPGRRRGPDALRRADPRRRAG